MSEPSTPELVARLSDPDPYRSFPARQALEKRGWQPANAREQVAALLCGSDYGPLIRMGRAALEPLLDCLQTSPSGPRRAFAATALGRLGVADAYDALVAATEDPEDSVRRQAILALGELADPRALELLAGLAERGSSQAATALATLGKASVPALVRLLSLWPVRSRWQVARYLGDLGDGAAGDALLDQMEEPHDTLRTEAALALGRLGDARALPALLAVAGDGWHGVEAVALMVKVLQAAAARVPQEDLEAASRFKGTEVYVTGEAEGYGSDPIIGVELVDGARVRCLAQAELQRRQG